MIRFAILETKRKKDEEELLMSLVAGKMDVALKAYWGQYGKEGYLIVVVKNGDKEIEGKMFPFKSLGDFAGAQENNDSYEKAHEEANKFFKEQIKLWKNVKGFQDIPYKEIEKMRKDGVAFWTNDKIRK